MSSPILFKQYIWLVNIIWKRGKISLADINKEWIKTDMSGGVEMARSTFNRHRSAIEDIFGILIHCDVNAGYKYFIKNDEALKGNTVQSWMLNTLSVGNTLSECISLQDRIVLEHIPAVGDYLNQIIQAMKENRRIKIAYRRYGTEQAKLLTFDPYCVKLFKQRWYVLGHFQRPGETEGEVLEYFGTFSFDRILELTVTDEKFIMDPDFSTEEYFMNYFGVVTGYDILPERIVLRAYGQEVFYMRDLPLHQSQKEITTTGEYAEFEYYMCPTLDFNTHLLSRGSMIKVLEPDWLADEIYNMLIEGALRYEEE